MVRCEAQRAEEVPLGCGEDLLERPQLPLPTALGAVSREKRLGYPPQAGPKARKGAQQQDDTLAPEGEVGTSLYINGVLRGRGP